MATLRIGKLETRIGSRRWQGARHHASSSLDQTGLAKHACLTHLGRDAATDRPASALALGTFSYLALDLGAAEQRPARVLPGEKEAWAATARHFASIGR